MRHAKQMNQDQSNWRLASLFVKRSDLMRLFFLIAVCQLIDHEVYGSQLQGLTYETGMEKTVHPWG